MNTGPELVRIDGVEVMLDEAWASPSVQAALRSGSYEWAEREVLAATLSPDDTYLELGCGIGVLATLAADRVGDRNVVAMEANPVIAEVARDTASRNGHTIEIRNVVLLEDPMDAVTSFYVRPDFRESSLSPLPTVQRNDESPEELQSIQVPAQTPLERSLTSARLISWSTLRVGRRTYCDSRSQTA
jgi:FkbM family methyltransferase